MAENKSKELDDLLQGFFKHVTERTGFKRADSDKLEAAGYVTVKHKGDMKARSVSLSDEGRDRLDAIRVERAEEKSLVVLRKFMQELEAALPGLTIDAEDSFESVADRLKTYSGHGRFVFYIVDPATSARVKLHIGERHSKVDPWASSRSEPLGQFDVTVGEWTDPVKFRSRKSGMPLAEIADAIKKKLVVTAQLAAAAVEEEARRGDLEARIDKLHAELGPARQPFGARLTVEAGGVLKLHLPKELTFEQAEALLRAAKKVGL